MAEVVRVPLDGGQDLRIEVDVRDENGWTRAGRAQDGADAGVVVARTAAEADFSVAVEWNRPSDG
ncbi:hypothetical protein [Streptomyces sp. NPDC001450]